MESSYISTATYGCEYVQTSREKVYKRGITNGVPKCASRGIKNAHTARQFTRACESGDTQIDNNNEENPRVCMKRYGKAGKGIEL